MYLAQRGTPFQGLLSARGGSIGRSGWRNARGASKTNMASTSESVTSSSTEVESSSIVSWTEVARTWAGRMGRGRGRGQEVGGAAVVQEDAAEPLNGLSSLNHHSISFKAQISLRCSVGFSQQQAQAGHSKFWRVLQSLVWAAPGTRPIAASFGKLKVVLLCEHYLVVHNGERGRSILGGADSGRNVTQEAKKIDLQARHSIHVANETKMSKPNLKTQSKTTHESAQTSCAQLLIVQVGLELLASLIHAGETEVKASLGALHLAKLASHAHMQVAEGNLLATREVWKIRTLASRRRASALSQQTASRKLRDVYGHERTTGTGHGVSESCDGLALGRVLRAERAVCSGASGGASITRARGHTSTSASDKGVLASHTNGWLLAPVLHLGPTRGKQLCSNQTDRVLLAQVRSRVLFLHQATLATLSRQMLKPSASARECPQICLRVSVTPKEHRSLHMWTRHIGYTELG
ncbi:hypothetical protein BC835DRAFT_1308809 [Cytidiella melzeri]|nr:hypothetical protein BC835DRAFT_1308809 [Cytidiella melzeri]